MATNFDYLLEKELFGEFAEQAVEAEKAIAISPATCAILSRRALELAVRFVYSYDYDLKLPYRDNVSSLIHEQTFRDIIEPGLFGKLKYVIKLGNIAVRIRKAFREDIDEYKIRAAAIQDTELYEGVFAIAESKSEGIESPTVFASKIANSLLDISNVKASFVLTKYRGKVYISARSIDEVNVQVMMERLGGGGHINMAGAQLENVEVEEAKNMIKQEIDSMIEEGEI